MASFSRRPGLKFGVGSLVSLPTDPLFFRVGSAASAYLKTYHENDENVNYAMPKCAFTPEKFRRKKKRRERSAHAHNIAFPRFCRKNQDGFDFSLFNQAFSRVKRKYRGCVYATRKAAFFRQ